MEALVVVAEHRNQYYGGRGKLHASRGFKGINCRTFQSGATSDTLSSPSSKVRPFTGSSEPKSPCFYSEPPKQSRKSKPFPINCSPSKKAATFDDDFSYSELWAGPAFSNSPPPSSLPIPKFSLRQKRSISLELSPTKSDTVLHPVSKSAPSSPTRESVISASDFFLNNATATENLRRILQLDISDD